MISQRRRVCCTTPQGFVCLAGEATGRRTGQECAKSAVGCDHKELGAKLLLGSDPEAAMTILGHHGGLNVPADKPVLF